MSYPILTETSIGTSALRYPHRRHSPSTLLPCLPYIACPTPQCPNYPALPTYRLYCPSENLCVVFSSPAFSDPFHAPPALSHSALLGTLSCSEPRPRGACSPHLGERLRGVRHCGPGRWLDSRHHTRGAIVGATGVTQSCWCRHNRGS